MTASMLQCAMILNIISFQKKCIPILENHDIFVSDTSTSFTNNIQDIYSFDFNSKGINIGHLNVQGICGDKMKKLLRY